MSLFTKRKELVKKGDELFTIDDEKVEWIEEESFFLNYQIGKNCY